MYIYLKEFINRKYTNTTTLSKHIWQIRDKLDKIAHNKMRYNEKKLKCIKDMITAADYVCKENNTFRNMLKIINC